MTSMNCIICFNYVLVMNDIMQCASDEIVIASQVHGASSYGD